MLYQEGFVCPCWNEENVSMNLQGRDIYKDECCKCFGNPKSPGGLSVNLRSLLGHCVAEHARPYALEKNFPLVMNIIKTPKAKNPDAEKITKLAIGMPGGIDAETDKFDTSV